MAVEFIGNGGPDGTTVGLSATEKVSFYGVTPCDQPVGCAAVGTSVALSCTASTGAYGFTATQCAAILALLTAVKANLDELGLQSTV